MIEMKTLAVPVLSGLHAFISHLAHVRTKDHPAYRNRGATGETLTPPERDHLYDNPCVRRFHYGLFSTTQCHLRKMGKQAVYPPATFISVLGLN
ncbi:hypothetical protein HDV63DRAFT_379248 [Trichoderma sp. SZMC 28014]